MVHPNATILDKINGKPRSPPPPPPKSRMGKWRVFALRAASSLIWRGWGFAVPFYFVQDCSFWAHGAPFGSFLNALTFSSSGASLLIRSWIFASLSRGRISTAILLRRGCCLAFSGVGISFLSCRIPSHSIRVGVLKFSLVWNL